jgi:hypothetical protein
MPDNTLPTGSQPSNESLPDVDQLTTWALMIYPHVDEDAYGRVVAAVKLALVVREEAALQLEKLRKPAQQKKAELQWGLEHFHHKTLIDPQDPHDQSTALGYLLVKHNFAPYKSTAALKEALVGHGVTIQNDIQVVTDVRTGETIKLGETVLESDLDRFIENLRAQKATAQRARDRKKRNRTNKNHSPENHNRSAENV